MIKSKRNYSFNRAAKFVIKTVSETLNDMARFQNEQIQTGIDTSTDIKGRKFTPLSKKSTLPIRNRKGQGFTPLDRMKSARQKKLRNTRIIPASNTNLASRILMLTNYGVFHNEGFIATGFLKKPKQVPKREWFGITKEMQPGGKQYEKFVKFTLFKITRSAQR